MTGPMQYEDIEALVRQGEREQRRKRRQFGLGKLLLWMGLAALLLGALRMAGAGPIFLASIASWVAIIGGVRLLFGAPVALAASIALGALALPALILAPMLSGSRAPPVSAVIPGLAMAAAGGGVAGYWSYVLLEILFTVVRLPEGLLRAEGYDRQGPI
jgi:hypothetical protein